MKFKLSTTGHRYKDEAKSELEELGFTFKRDSYFCSPRWCMVASEVCIELSTLEELVEFTNTWGDCVVKGDSIEIYDDYRE